MVAIEGGSAWAAPTCALRWGRCGWSGGVGQEQAVPIAGAPAPSLPTRRLPDALRCELLLLQDSQNSAHPWPRGRSRVPGRDLMAL